MSGSGALILWLCVVIVSATVIVYLARRWGHDPFGWVLLAAAMGPFAVVALVGTRVADRAGRPRKGAIRPGIGGVVLATDGSEIGDALAHHLINLRRTGEVVVLHVLPYESQPQDSRNDAFRTALEATRGVLNKLQKAGVQARFEVRYGVPGEAIVTCADEINAELILVGRRGSGLARALLGSTSRFVVENAARPVVVVG